MCYLLNAVENMLYIYFKTVVVLQGSTIVTSMYLIDDNCTVRNLCVVCGEYRALVLSVTSIEIFVLSVMSIEILYCL